MRRVLLSLVLLLTLGATCASAQVSHVSDSASTGNFGTGTSIVFSGFSGSGTNPVIAVGIALNDATATVSTGAVSAGLTSGTIVEVKNVRDTANGGGQFTSIWCIPAPSGTGTITMTLSASVHWQAAASLFAGADQTTPCPSGDATTDVVATVGVQNYTLTPASLTANDATFAVGGDDNSDVFGVTPNQTYFDDTTVVNMEAGYALGTGGVTVSYTLGQHNLAKVAIRIAAAGAGGAHGPCLRMLLGVGACDAF